jgi:HEAT repeat protein
MALRALGTNAALYLGQEYLREDGWFGINYRKVYGQVPGALQKLFPEPPIPRSAVRANIGDALAMLEQEAIPAVPALLSALRTGNSATRSATLGVLRRIPFDRRLLDPILDNWSRNGDHTNVLLVVGELQVYTQMTAACLTRILVESDVALRQSALYQLEKCGPTAATALPEVIVSLTDTDDETRYLGARVLVAIGPAAAPAIPALTLATADASVMVQRASARALLAIQGKGQE